jgi:hypothetical protein
MTAKAVEDAFPKRDARTKSLEAAVKYLESKSPK